VAANSPRVISNEGLREETILMSASWRERGGRDIWNREGRSRSLLYLSIPLSLSVSPFSLSLSLSLSLSSFSFPCVARRLSETSARVSTNGTREREWKAPPRMTTLRHSCSAFATFRSKSPPDFDELFASRSPPEHVALARPRDATLRTADFRLLHQLS